MRQPPGGRGRPCGCGRWPDRPPTTPPYGSVADPLPARDRSITTVAESCSAPTTTDADGAITGASCSSASPPRPRNPSMSPSVEPHPTGPRQHTVARGDQRPTCAYNLRRVRRFDRSCLRPDGFAGLGVAAYLVPQVMAYATLAGLDPVVGLWACLVPLAIYALAGHVAAALSGPGVDDRHHDGRGAGPTGRRRRRDLRHHGRVHGAARRGDVPAGRHPAAGDRRLPAEQAGADRLPRGRRGHHDRRPAGQVVRHHRLRRHAADPDLVGRRPARATRTAPPPRSGCRSSSCCSSGRAGGRACPGR